MPTQIQIQIPRSMERSAISKITPEGKRDTLAQRAVSLPHQKMRGGGERKDLRLPFGRVH
eukprot:461892-Pelagomonas_calceolata.AAC.1